MMRAIALINDLYAGAYQDRMDAIAKRSKCDVCHGILGSMIDPYHWATRMGQRATRWQWVYVCDAHLPDLLVLRDRLRLLRAVSTP